MAQLNDGMTMRKETDLIKDLEELMQRLPWGTVERGETPMTYSGNRLPYGIETIAMAIFELQKYEELKKKISGGQLTELPCKVGDTVYEVFKEHKPPIVQETTIDKIIITKKGLRVKLARNSCYETSVSSFGKTIFFNEEAAEAKLEELKNK